MKKIASKCAGKSMVLIAFVVLISSVTVFGQDDGINALRQTGKAFASVAKKASPAVVGVKVEKVIKQDRPSFEQSPFGGPFDPFGDDFFERFFRHRYPRQYRQAPRQRRAQAQGSGFIITADGYILTNNHVVEDADKITVMFADGQEEQAKLIGTDPDTDVAVIKVEGKKFSYLELADSDKLEVGEWVLAIGNPFGLSHTVTAGIVSAKGRSGLSIAEYEDFIQTDAAINSGNSGGPLINLDSKVVGINTAIIGARGNIGIGLAIPINMAKNVYEMLVEGKNVSRGVLGVQIEQLTAETADKLGIEETEGVLIVDVFEDTPAEKAGLKRYDVIIELNGKRIEKLNKFRNRIAMLGAGTKVELIVLRDGKKKPFTIKLGSKSEVYAGGRAGQSENEQLGLTVTNLTDEFVQRFGYDNLKGVVVSKVANDSIAAFTGIRVGMLIEEIDRQPINNVRDFNKAMKKVAKEGSVLLLINNGRFRQLINLPLQKK